MAPEESNEIRISEGDSIFSRSFILDRNEKETKKIPQQC